MPDTVDHRVEMFRLASARQAAGLPSWAHHIDVSDLFHNDALSFTEKRDAIVTRIRATVWFRSRDTDGFDELGDVVENLSIAEDVDEFDGWWDALYDHADYDRVWIRT